ncbi:MAG: protein jag [Deltaproteobacteria bacterium]|nr:Jag N-terminal domain-containing protein [Deltaproteobacteria bacterium]MBW2076017.1 Jag N-terminal domain-containing protein [Deltaproteobacteria bacterium]MBW2309486.1 Jag N-terminal domain-containing protein [Deltaproteobacteria bacterium]RLB30458.1 MAG: protein jag [Deltaproteobacteria bacterium]
MSSIEIEAKTTQEAIKKACEHFQMSQEELDIEVLESRSAGIFGIAGNRKAKIKATPKGDASMVLAQKTLTKILSLISPNTEVFTEKRGDDIILNCKGNNPGILIGSQGKTLEAIEFIINKAVNRVSEKKIRVIVDTENYRKRREESLKRLALSMGEKAKKTGKPVITNPMNPHERRTVHLALKADQAIQTKSKGEGLYKKILIIPNAARVDEKQGE